MAASELLKKSRKFAKDYAAENIPKEYVFHSVQHFSETVDAIGELCEAYQLSPETIEEAKIAMWFHDLGFSNGWTDHEFRSAEIAGEFLKKEGVSEERIERVKEYILATRGSVEPNSLIEEIVKDADTSHIGTKAYFTKLGLLKSEWDAHGRQAFTDKEWLKFNLEFLQNHKFHTAVAKTTYDARKHKNILKLQKQWKALLEYEQNLLPQEKLEQALTVPKKAERGVETMFRVTLRNHNNLSRIADNKANIMLSINAIMLSIVISSLTPKLDANPRLIVPTIIIIIVCMISIILATISTRPKITSANYTDEKFLEKRFNILFFGNFYQIPLDKFEWGVNKLMHDESMLYSSLAKDLYYLGLVLAKKYKYLYICYNVFMAGLLLAAISFIISFLPNGPV